MIGRTNDKDDLCVPDRFEMQIKLFKEDANLYIVEDRLKNLIIILQILLHKENCLKMIYKLKNI